MKPVEKGAAPRRYAHHTDAKEDLIARLGNHCSYCEAPAHPTDLDVEHIYSQAGHARRKVNWDNFLLSCTICNNAKSHHLGPGRTHSLLKRYLWPHVDNTARVFVYHADGRVEIEPGLSLQVRTLAAKTIEMTGLLKTPARARGYSNSAVAYAGVTRRAQAWGRAVIIRGLYLQHPSAQLAAELAGIASGLGYFSVWMKVFEGYPEFRQALITAFVASPACFDANTAPVARGRA